MIDKRLIVTRADEKIVEMSEISHPLIKKYANKCQADFLILDKDYPCKDKLGTQHYRILNIEKLYDNYDRILCLDTDILISDICPLS